MFSVVLPTLQLSWELRPLLDLYDAHPLVGEVIVINNAPAPLEGVGRKVRVLDQPTNLFVNPSWNLGVMQARFDHLAISNDDVMFPPPLLNAVAGRLTRRVGMIGPHTSCLRPGRSRAPVFLPAYSRTPGFGTLFFMSRSDWVPIPDDLLIWCGDDFQFSRQTKRNLWFVGPRIVTPMGVTSRRAEFSSQKQADLAVFNARYRSDDPYLARFGFEAAVSRRTRRALRTLRSLRRGPAAG